MKIFGKGDVKSKKKKKRSPLPSGGAPPRLTSPPPPPKKRSGASVSVDKQKTSKRGMRPSPPPPPLPHRMGLQTAVFGQWMYASKTTLGLAEDLPCQMRTFPAPKSNNVLDHTHELHFIQNAFEWTYSQLCLSRICRGLKKKLRLRENLTYEGLKTIEYL